MPPRRSTSLGVGFEARIISAHRTPERLFAFAKGAKAEGFKIIIAGAGGAAHLPGMAASLTPLPVFGVPVESKALSGQDSLLSIVQMPAGIPVGTLAIGRAGAVNAALLAAAVLALGDERIWPRASMPSGPSRPTPSPCAPRARADPVIAPGSTIGILGGGQLGRMIALAAAELGLKVHVYAPEADSPAFDVAARHTVADYLDEEALVAFAASVSAVTYEFENVPSRAAEILGAHAPLAPNALALATTQDRLKEKTFVSDLGIATATFAAVENEADLEEALRVVGQPAILKTRRFGYDGKGQVMIRPGVDAAAAFADLGRAPCILEGFVPFEREVSVVAARAASGEFAAYDPCANTHRSHILDVTQVPAGIAAQTAQEAALLARRIADALDYVGVFAVEMFLVRDPGGGTPRRQRDRPARPQFRALDDRRRGDVAIRAACAGGLRLAARRHGSARARRDAQPHRRGCRKMGRAPRGEGCAPAPLRQGTRQGPAARWGT